MPDITGHQWSMDHWSCGEVVVVPSPTYIVSCKSYRQTAWLAQILPIVHVIQNSILFALPVYLIFCCAVVGETECAWCVISHCTVHKHHYRTAYWDQATAQQAWPARPCQSQLICNSCHTVWVRVHVSRSCLFYDTVLVWCWILSLCAVLKLFNRNRFPISGAAKW